MKPIQSFSTRLSLNVVLVVSILFLIALLTVAIFSHLLITDEANKSANNTLAASIADIEKTLQSVEAVTENAAWMAEENCNNEDFLYHITEKVVSTNPYIIGSAIAFDTNRFQGQYQFAPYACSDNKTGKITHKRLDDNYNYFPSEWFATPYKSGAPHWSEPYFDKGGADCMMSTYSYPIKDKQGKVFAIITADISLDWLTQKAESIHPYEHSFTTLLSKEGRPLSENKANVRVIDNKVLVQHMTNGQYGTTGFKENSKRGFTVFGPFDNGWSMAITSQYRDVLHRSIQMHKILFIVGIIGLIVLFFTCYRIIRTLTKPITEFTDVAQAMAAGDFKAQLPVIKSQDELLHLHESFDQLQKSFISYIDELKTTTAANERMESELYIARAIQQGMLPSEFPQKEAYNLHAMLTPAKEVGGDYYNFFEKDNLLYFSIGDVSGKGVPAALVMAITQAACKFFFKMNLPVKQVISELNNTASDGNDTNMFATMFAGCLNLDTLTMEYCNAGHNHIIVIPARSDQQPYYLMAKANLALGLFADFQYEKESLQLERGCRLILYTDGVTEAENAQQAQYGDERLLATTSTPEFRQLDAQGMVDHIYKSVQAFTDGNEQNDDITILCVKIGD